MTMIPTIAPTFMVRQHAVPIPQGNASDFETWASQQGLSPMQRALLDRSLGGAVRVVDAPTGSGKSFAFQKAVVASSGLPRPGNVLFIAPTRRLTDALAQDLRIKLHDELRNSNLKMDESSIGHLVDQKVLVWNGAQSIPEGLTARQHRHGQLNAQTSDRHEHLVGMTVFMVVEILEKMLFPRIAKAGSIDETTYQFLGKFQHIVFDEFHTLDRGAMALAILVAGLVKHAREQAREIFITNLPTVTFLSATPVNVESLLEAADIQLFDSVLHPDGYVRVVEAVVDRLEPNAVVDRVLHGDVHIAFENAPSLMSVVMNHLPEVQHELKEHRQVVVVYNELSALKRDQGTLGGGGASPLQDMIDALGIRPEKVLLINSADDRTEFLDGNGSLISTSSVQVANRDSTAFDLLIATSSVEAGVTFRNNRLLFMEPGMNPLNFMQRVGRTARGAMHGKVFVRCDDEMIKKLRYSAQIQGSPHGAWLEKLMSIAQNLSKEPDGISIRDFQSLMKSLAVGVEWQLNQGNEAQELTHYRSIGKRVVLHMRLYWALQTFLLTNKFSKNTPQGVLDLWAAAPTDIENLRKELMVVNAKIQRLPTRGRVSGEPLKKWWLAFQMAVLDLRNIGATVKIEDHDHQCRLRRRPFNVVHVLNKTSLMDHVSLEIRGQECVLVYKGNADTLYNAEQGEGKAAREWDVRDVLDPRNGKAYAAEMLKACKSSRDVVIEINTTLENMAFLIKAYPDQQKAIQKLAYWLSQTNLVVWSNESDLTNAFIGSIPSMVL